LYRKKKAKKRKENNSRKEKPKKTEGNRRKMGSAMSIQEDNFNNQAKKHYSNKQLAYCVTLWEQGENNKMIFNKTEVPNGVLKHDHDFGGMPVFQTEVQEGWDLVKVKTPEENGTLVLKAEGDLACYSFMPAGFRDGPTPNKINPFREEIGNSTGETPEKCASSLCHIVSTPKNIRKYNIITCNTGDIGLLNELDRLGRQACLSLRDGPDTMVGSLRWHMKQDGAIEMKDGRVVSTKLLESDFVDATAFNKAQTEGVESVKQMFEDSLQTTFHTGEAASVGYLHSHTRPTCFDLTSRQKMDEMANDQGYIKEITLEEAIGCLQSEEFSKIVNDLDQSEEEEEEEDEEALVRTKTTR